MARGNIINLRNVSEPEPPTLEEALRLWRMAFDTSHIARMYGVREAVVYNMLARAFDGRC